MAANLYAAAVNSVFMLTVRCVLDNKTITGIVSPIPSADDPTGGAPDAWNACRNISEFFAAAAAGACSINISYADGVSTAQATNTLVFTTNAANADTITLQGVAITITNGTPTTNQVKLGATQAATMANIVAFINAGGSAGSIAGVCTAVVTNSTTITLTSMAPGIVGNTITLTVSSSHYSAGAGAFSGGAAVNQSSLLSVGA